MKKFQIPLIIIFLFSNFVISNFSFACDPNEECNKCLVKKPFGGCFIRGNDPECEARKKACQIFPPLAVTIFNGPLFKGGVIPKDTIDKCIQYPGKCLDEVVARGGYEFVRPITDAYFGHLRNQAAKKFNKIPESIIQKLQPYYNFDLRNVKYATNINTVHGQNITVGSEIFFINDIDFNACSDFILLAHELEHVSQYASRGGVEAFIPEYILKAIGKVLETGTFNVHDYIDIESSALTKAEVHIGCAPLIQGLGKQANLIDVDFDNDGLVDSFGLIEKGHVIHFGSGEIRKTIVNDKFDSLMGGKSLWLPGDFNGDSISDLVVLVSEKNTGYLHVFYGNSDKSLGTKNQPAAY